jgi:pimeloyl-ACP methyl ester carboxylesterase
VAADRAALSPATLAAQRAAIGTWSTKGLARPGADSPPVLAVCGSEDAVIRPENTDRLVARWPNCRAERFEGDGHALQAQEPERLAALISSFLHQCAAAR